MTARPLLTAKQRQRYAIARSRERRAAEMAPLLAKVDRLIGEAGWRQAAAVVEVVMAPVRVTGPRGVWRRRVGKRTGTRLLAALSALPAQQRLPLVQVSRPTRNVNERGTPCTS